MGARCKARNYCRRYYFASNKGKRGNHLEEKSSDNGLSRLFIVCISNEGIWWRFLLKSDECLSQNKHLAL